jgi:RNA polymerase sigma-32 factor
MTQHTLFDEEDGYRAYLSQLQRYEPLDRETERRLARRWARQHDLDAAHQLVRANLRFVVKIANGYRNYGLRVADLVEEGNVGLLEALKRFDPDRGLRFMTYAAYWVRAYILSHVLKQRYMVGVGTGPMQSKLFFRLACERARLASSLGEDENLDGRLAETFGTTEERIRAMSGRMGARDVSLDASLDADGTRRGLDLLVGDTDTESECADAERDRLVRQRVSAAMHGFSARERYIVNHRLLTDDKQTLAQIGRKLGVSRERVRQLEERVKGRLARVLADLVDGTPTAAPALPIDDGGDDDGVIESAAA